MERYIQRNWLKQLTAKLVAEDKITSQTAQTINDEADATNDFALYKIFKSISGFIGAALIFAGLLTIFSDFLITDSGSMKMFCFIPGLLGGGFYYYYISHQRNSKLWKELAVPIFMLSVALSFLMILGAYKIDFINNKLILYMILTWMLWLIYRHNSLVSGCIYLIMISFIGASMSGLSSAVPGGYGRLAGGFLNADGYSWLWVLSWAYLIAIVPFMLHRLKDIGMKLGLKEAILSWLFVGAAYNYALGMTGGFPGLGLLVIAPVLYMMSKRYYGQATWFFNRPGSTTLVYFAIFFTMIFANKATGIGLTSLGFPKDIGLNQILALLVIIGIGLYGFKFYKSEIEAKGIKLNMILMTFPAVLFIGGLIGSDGGYAIFTLYGLILFGSYVKEGLAMKYSPLVLLGGVFGLLFICIRLLLNLMEHIDSQMMVGIALIFFGGIFLGTVLYLKSQWSVSDDHVNPEDDNILDGALAKAKSIDVKAVMDDVKDTVQNANKPSAPKAPPASQSPSSPETPSESESNRNDSTDGSDNGANESDSSNDEPKTES